MAHNSRVELGRPDQGGVWFRGLCRKCNTAAGQFDTAYAHLADILRPLWLASLNQSSPQDQATPHDPIRPGAVARSIMLGMCATTPIIRFNWPQVRQLLSSKRVQLPDQYRLYLAAAQGRSAWVSGTIAGHYSNANTTMNSPAVMMSMSAVFFPPLAWQLVATDGCQPERWADVSSWCEYPPDREIDLHELVDRVRFDCHPRHKPNGDTNWIDHIQSDVSSIIESFDITGSDPYITEARRRLMQRRLVPTDEVFEALRRNGYDLEDV